MVELQIVSIFGEDIDNNDSDSEDECSSQKQYTISIIGRSQDNKSICLKTAFNPFLFVEIPEDYNNQQSAALKTSITKLLYKNINAIKSVSIVERKKFFGFTNHKIYKFFRFVFHNYQSYKRVMYGLRKPITVLNRRLTVSVYEANIDPMLKFCHVQNIETAGWINVTKFEKCTIKETYCDEEYTCKWNSINPIDKQSIAPIVQASFDIETYSADGSFPDPKNEECPVIQIATTLQRYGEKEPYKKQLLSLGTCNNIEGVEVIECETEAELLNTWTKLIQTENADILIGYNIWGFDLWYMITRADMVNATNFKRLGRFKNYECELRESSFSSSAYGHTDYKMVDTPGRFQLDLLVVMKRDHKLTSYTLNNVSEHFLKDKKVDMPYKLMFKKYKMGAEERKEIGIYCVKDTDLPLLLINKLAIVPNMIEMAKATWVPLSYLIERGQGIKVFSQLLYNTRQENMLVLTLNKGNDVVQEPYEGATVLTAKKGAYMDEPITGLDFASLYPTIMRAHNFSHDTLVMNKEFENIEGIEYKEVTVETTTYKFAQGEEGIFPKMLRILATNRKAAKKQMKEAANSGDIFMESVYNGKQLAFKVSMNSMYGFCGANLGLLPCKPVASCTTSIGRGMIEHTKKCVEDWYPGSEVVYGDTDSVMVKFFLDGKKGQEGIEKSFELGIEASERITKTFKEPIELEFEKVYKPYLLFSKKRYAGLMYTRPDKPDYIDAKGIQLVRRDNCPFVKAVSREALDTIMYKLDINAAIEIAKKAAVKLLNYEVKIEDLVVSKSLKKISYNYEDKEKTQGYPFKMKSAYSSENQPHLTVAMKQEMREPGYGPKSGDRVPYIFLDTGNRKHLQFEKAEDPQYTIDNNLKVDVEYYLDHGLRSPLESLFEVFMENPESIFNDSRMKFRNTINKQRDIWEYLKI